MSRSTEPRRARRRIVAVVAATALSLVPALVATSPAAAATWTISGTIGNWDASLVGTEVTVVLDDGSVPGTHVGELILTGPSFVWDSADAIDPSVLVDGRYTLHFDVDDTVEFIDGYLGGGLKDEYPDVTWLDADPMSDVDAGTFDLIEATYISGTVTGGGTPIDDADVYADDSGYFDAWGVMPNPFTAQTDSSGNYTLKVAAGRTYVISAEHPDWPSQTYRLRDGCGCDYDPVPGPLKPTLPATGVDFAFADPEAYLLGSVYSGDLASAVFPIEDVEVHIYQPVSGGWAEVDIVGSDVAGEWERVLADPGPHRLRFSLDGDWLKVDDAIRGIFGDTEFDEDLGVCHLDTGDIPPGEVYVAVVTLIDPALDSLCGAEPAPSGGGGGASPPRPRPFSSVSEVAPTPTPTLTPTPTTAPTPRPSASASPTASPAPEPAPASAPDLWWLLWVLLAVAVIAIVGGVLYLARRA